MTETGMAVKTKTISMSSTAQKPAERSSTGSFTLHNGTNGQVSVFRQEWDVPKQLFDLAPGTTSDQHEAGHEIYILFSGSGESTIINFDSQASYSIHYHVAGYTSSGTNNVSSFH